jgi:hypothetical protein
MPIAAIIELLVQVLPMLATDAVQLSETLTAANSAVNAANANGGIVPAAEWTALDQLRAKAETAWTAASA